MQEEREPDLITRASSLAEFLDCPARWQAKHLLGKKLPSGAPAIIGNGFHAGSAHYDSAILEGQKPSSDLIGDAMEAAAETVRNPRDDVHWDDMRPAEAIDIAVKNVQMYCTDIASRFTFVEVERKLDNLDVIASNGVFIRFTGTMDRKRSEVVPIEPGLDLIRTGIVDFKTGKRIVTSDGKVNIQTAGAQLAQYELLDMMSAGTTAERNLLPAGVVAIPTAGKHGPKFATIDNPHKLLITEGGKKGVIDMVADIYKHDLFYGNPRSMLCNKKYCPIYDTCRWRFAESTSVSEDLIF